MTAEPEAITKVEDIPESEITLLDRINLINIGTTQLVVGMNPEVFRYLDNATRKLVTPAGKIEVSINDFDFHKDADPKTLHRLPSKALTITFGDDDPNTENISLIKGMIRDKDGHLSYAGTYLQIGDNVYQHSEQVTGPDNSVRQSAWRVRHGLSGDSYLTSRELAQFYPDQVRLLAERLEEITGSRVEKNTDSRAVNQMGEKFVDYIINSATLQLKN